MSDLKNIGYSDWFKNREDDEKITNHGIARITSVHKDSYTVSNGGGEIFAELSGNLLYCSDFPTTGDWVYADFYDDDTHAIIYDVFPRKTLLKRKTAGKLVDFQLIAAIKAGELSKHRYQNYLKMKKESEFNQMSYLEKRNKDKSFGKLCKSAIKNKRR